MIFLIFILIFLQSKKGISIEEDDQQFLRKDCYESFSLPIQKIELFHDFPQGPVHIFAKFTFKLYSTQYDPASIIISQRYNFKRVGGRCFCSLLFTTKGENFLKIILKVDIFLFNEKSRLSSIFYTFYKGFNSGSYTLLGDYTNFGISVDIFNFGNNYSTTILTLLNDDIEYLESIKNNYSDICVVTENNRFVVLRPNENDEKHEGFINMINAEYYDDRKYNGHYTYTAFECQSDESYPNHSVIFIDEQPLNSLFYLSVQYFSYGTYFQKQTLIRFKISNITRASIYNIKNVSPSLKRVFFMNKRKLSKNLKNGNKLISYISSNKTVYKIYELKNTTVTPKIVRRQYIVSRSVYSNG